MAIKKTARKVTIHFRVTIEEFGRIKDAAEIHSAELEAEMTKRGLSASPVQMGPHEWAREIVLHNANEVRKQAYFME